MPSNSSNSSNLSNSLNLSNSSNINNGYNDMVIALTSSGFSLYDAEKIASEYFEKQRKSLKI